MPRKDKHKRLRIPPWCTCCEMPFEDGPSNPPVDVIVGKETSRYHLRCIKTVANTTENGMSIEDRRLLMNTYSEILKRTKVRKRRGG